MSLSLSQRTGRLVEPYEPGVYMLTGINGIGKSTVTDAITEYHPETVPVHASSELRGLFNNVTREELELLTPEEKLSRMVVHFTTIFERNLNDGHAVIMDTHLLVPIRKDGSVLYEDIWSCRYAPYVRAMAMLAANPHSVREWRMKDELDTGRKRNVDIDAIAADQAENMGRFWELQEGGELPAASGIVMNKSGHIGDTMAAVEQVFRS